MRTAEAIVSEPGTCPQPKSRGKPSAILRALPNMLYRTGLDGQMSGPRYYGAALAKAIGFKPKAFQEDRTLWLAHIHPDDMPILKAHLRRTAELGASSSEYRWRCADGTERVFLDQARLIRDDDGRALEIIGNCVDMTGYSAAFGRSKAEVKPTGNDQSSLILAHEMNNMLTVIVWNLDSLTRASEASEQSRRKALTAMGGALGCRELVRQMAPPMRI